MAKAKGAQRAGRTVVLPPLERFEGDTLEQGAEYEMLEFAGLDFADQDASDARFGECRLLECRLDGLILRRSRFSQSVVDEPQASIVDVSDSVWRDVIVRGGRLGAIRGPGASWTDVGVNGVKLNFADLTGSRLRDVAFDACEIGELDLGDAVAESLRFDGSRIEELNLAGAKLTDVDLSGAIVRRLRGVESLRGATLSRQQLTDLAPLLAAHLGIEVRD